MTDRGYEPCSIAEHNAYNKGVAEGRRQAVCDALAAIRGEQVFLYLNNWLMEVDNVSLSGAKDDAKEIMRELDAKEIMRELGCLVKKELGG